MRGAARTALTRGCRLLEAQDSLDLVQLCIGILELRCPSHDHVDPDPVPDRHLVDQAAEIPLELGHASVQLVTAPLQVDKAGIVRRHAEGAVSVSGRLTSAAPSHRAPKRGTHGLTGPLEQLRHA